MKLTGFAIIVGGMRLPTTRTNDIQAAVAVDVADTQAVRIAEGSRNFMARRAGLADRMHLPELRRIFAGSKPGHLSLMLFALGLEAHDPHAFAGAEQVGVKG